MNKGYHRHLGAYGIIIEKESILLIKKKGGPYDGKLDLPGGGLKEKESPKDALIREMMEETNLMIDEYTLFDADSVVVDWIKENEIVEVHHIGIFYKIQKYHGNIKEKISITKQNDDSQGACFYKIKDLTKDNLSQIAIIELEKLGYKIN